MTPNAPRTPARSIRLDDAVWDALRARADVEGRTASDVVRAAVVAYLDRPSAFELLYVANEDVTDDLAASVAAHGRTFDAIADEWHQAASELGDGIPSAPLSFHLRTHFEGIDPAIVGTGS